MNLGQQWGSPRPPFGEGTFFLEMRMSYIYYSFIKNFETRLHEKNV